MKRREERATIVNILIRMRVRSVLDIGLVDLWSAIRKEM